MGILGGCTLILLGMCCELTGDDTQDNDYRGAVANAPCLNALSQPPQDSCPCRQHDCDQRHEGHIAARSHTRQQLCSL